MVHLNMNVTEAGDSAAAKMKFNVLGWPFASVSTDVSKLTGGNSIAGLRDLFLCVLVMFSHL